MANEAVEVVDGELIIIKQALQEQEDENNKGLDV